jgi:GxxExxY protein
LEIFYKNDRLEQYYEPDFLCYNEIILEIKAVKTLNDEHKAQVINYLKATGKRLGLLVNFGHYTKMEQERLLN